MQDTCNLLVGVIVGDNNHFVTAWAHVNVLPTLMASTVLEFLLGLLNIDVVGSIDIVDVGRPRCLATTLLASGAG